MSAPLLQLAEQGKNERIKPTGEEQTYPVGLEGAKNTEPFKSAVLSELRNTNSISEAAQKLLLDEYTMDQLGQAYETARVDRFIVKFKEANPDKSQFAAERIESIGKGKNSEILQLFTLPQKVNPSEYADMLKSHGLASQIEYITPDFLMEYAGFGLSYIELAPQTDLGGYEGQGGQEGQEDKSKLEAGANSGQAVGENPDEQDSLKNQDRAKEQNPLGQQNGSNEPGYSKRQDENDGEDGQGEGLSNDTEGIESAEENLDGGQDDKEEPLSLPQTDNEEIIVAIIDSGIDVSHEGLDGAFVEGWDFIEDDGIVYNSSNPMSNSHGTHIAGIIKNAVSGAEVKMMPLRVFGEHGAYTSDILQAIAFAEENGARIANCSFGSGQYNPALEEAIANSGMLFVASVGNSRSDLSENPVYPAAFELENIISVSSVNEDGGFSFFSNFNNSIVDIAARGRDVHSTLPEGGYGLQSGTSMAAAQVSGASAAVLSFEPELGASALRLRMISTADKLSNLLLKVKGGRRLNITNALNNDEQSQVLELSPSDDFDVHGHAPSPEENWNLFSNNTVVDISAGGLHTVALMSDGTVWAWGNSNSGSLGDGTSNYYIKRGSPHQVLGLTDVIAISAAGGGHSLALKSDNTLWAWGNNNSGQLGDGTTSNRSVPVQVGGLTGVVKISTGNLHSLAIKLDGSVWAWGYNNGGQLGDLTTTSRSTPIQVGGIAGAVGISGGHSHSLAVKFDGTVWAWGQNSYGQLGDGTLTNRLTPVQTAGLSGVVDVAAGHDNSLALLNGGTLMAWGSNSYGQLGTGSGMHHSTAVQVYGLTGIVSVSTGNRDSYHVLALKSDGTIWAFGSNRYGKIGDETTINRALPVQVAGVSNAIAVSAGYLHSMAIRDDGAILSWGSNHDGQLGCGGYTISNTPIQANGLSNVASVSAGEGQSLALMTDGTVFSWGNNWYGQLGDGTEIGRGTPAQINTLSSIIEIAAGSTHCLALKLDGSVLGWGQNAYGNLGDGTTTSKSVPVNISGFSGAIAVAAGENYSLVLKSDGTVWASGSNYYGQLGDGTTTNRNAPVQVVGLSNVVSIAAGRNHGLALKGDGSLWAWGENTYGQLGDGTTTSRSIPAQVSGINNVVSISIGSAINFAVKSDNSVWGWGYNGIGLLGDGTKVSKSIPVQVNLIPNMSNVSVGGSHCVATDSSGIAYAWGFNENGQLGNNSLTSQNTPQPVNGLSGVAAVSTGNNHSLAVKEDGTVFSWGDDVYGQLGRGRLIETSSPVQINMPSNSLMLSFSQSAYSFEIPQTGSGITPVAAAVYDDYGPIPNAAIFYSIVVPYPGVSIDLASGAVTVYSTAAPGTVIIKAAYNGIESTVDLTLSNNIPQNNSILNLSVYYEHVYFVFVNALDITSFSGKTISVEYDPALLQLMDAGAQAYGAQTTVGIIPGTNTTIASISSNSIVLQHNTTVPPGKFWSGTITVLKFKALTSGVTTIYVE